MKEIINIIVIIASILGGTAAFKSFHDSVRNVALEKSAKGLPSLEAMSRNLQQLPASRTNQSQINKLNDSGPHDQTRRR